MGLSNGDASIAARSLWVIGCLGLRDSAVAVGSFSMLTASRVAAEQKNESPRGCGRLFGRLTSAVTAGQQPTLLPQAKVIGASVVGSSSVARLSPLRAQGAEASEGAVGAAASTSPG
jgi:hypothetical protein